MAATASPFGKTRSVDAFTADQPESHWWAVYTKARQEKSLARQLVGLGVPFYLPLIPRVANIGGRLIGTSFAWVTATLAVTPDRAYAPTKVALMAAAVGFSVYLVGLVASAWLPEPPREDHN